MKNTTHQASHAKGNRLLSLLDEETLIALVAKMERVPLELRVQLYWENEPITHVYFPLLGVVSMLASIEGTGDWIEVATVGNEGMIGLQLFLGTELTPGNSFVQISGSALRIPA